MLYHLTDEIVSSPSSFSGGVIDLDLGRLGQFLSWMVLAWGMTLDLVKMAYGVVRRATNLGVGVQEALLEVLEAGLDTALLDLSRTVRMRLVSALPFCPPFHPFDHFCLFFRSSPTGGKIWTSKWSRGK